MGQYFLLCNVTKKQFVCAHDVKASEDEFRGLKLGEGGYDDIYALLLCDFGGGYSKFTELMGSWAGDQVVLAGDYAEEGKFLTPEQIQQYQADVKRHSKEEIDQLVAEGYERAKLENPVPNLFLYADKYFENISAKVTEMLIKANSR